MYWMVNFLIIALIDKNYLGKLIYILYQFQTTLGNGKRKVNVKFLPQRQLYYYSVKY